MSDRPGVMLQTAYQVLHIGFLVMMGLLLLNAEKILITGATGKIAFPIARALAATGTRCGVPLG